ncbi:hypothetical protein HK099_006420 [Clydaea vesicula]|uniref:Band 7 domain-containing protein n=1 Tax=Clydaea vesicula TaxID=447962 RepID=A0AAD5U172_9FUNG|nr:hypothetical protein HK099_006420 [Clydaea vesicula]
MQPTLPQPTNTIGPFPCTSLINASPQAITPMSTQRLFFHEIPVAKSEDYLYEGCLTFWGKFFGMIGATPCGWCFPNPYKIINQGEVGLITKFGKYYKSVDPGLYEINIFTELVLKVNIKLQVDQIYQQTITTKDNVSCQIDSVLYWHIVDPFTARFLVENVRVAMIERTQTTLRTIFGTKTLQECIEHRESIAVEISELIDKPAAGWGVKLESILIKDLQFSKDLQENLSAAAKAKRIGESKVIAAKAEVESAKLMREAADILNHPAAMQIRYLETLTGMAKSSDSKVIFMPASESEFQKKAKNDLSEVVSNPFLNEIV